MSPASGAAAAGGGRRVTFSSISCRGVKAFVPFQKPPLYAAVSLGRRREKTAPDTGGGENPDWEGAVVAFDLDGDVGQQQEQAVQFEVKAQVPLLGTKVVGTASVPVAYLAAADGAAPQHVSYQVRAPDGKPNGTLSFAYAISSSGTGGARPQQQLHTVPDGATSEQAPSFCGAPPRPQLHTVPDGAPPGQGPTFCSAPPQPPSGTAYPAPSTANFAPHGGGYPAQPPPSTPVSGSLYPPLQDLLPSSTYPPPPPSLPHPTMANPHFPEPHSSSYPPPPSAPNSASVYPPPPDSCTTRPAPPAHYITSYPPPPSTYPPPLPSTYPPSPPSGYPPPAFNLAPPTGTYPPPPPESGSAYPVRPRSAPSGIVDRELPYYPAPSSTYAPPPGGSLYPPPELDGAARTQYCYPPPGSRYP